MSFAFEVVGRVVNQKQLCLLKIIFNTLILLSMFSFPLIDLPVILRGLSKLNKDSVPVRPDLKWY